VPDLAEPADEAILTWTTPTMNMDGTPLTNLAGYYVYHGIINPLTVDNSTKIDVGNVNTYTFYHLASGTHYFAVSTYNTNAEESDLSQVGTKVVP
jgi:hypothetical protein